MIPDLLKEEITSFKEAGYQIQLDIVGDTIFIIFKDYILPKGYNQKKTNILVRTTKDYPDIAFDMFWTSASLLLADGGVPKNALHVKRFGSENKPWRMFSIHPYKHKKWDPSEDDLIGYMIYIKKRLELGQ